MSNMNSRTRKYAQKLLTKRDGRYCNMCGAPGGFKKTKTVSLLLLVDHIDNDNSNNPPDGSNWQLLCRSCNALKNPRTKHPKAAVVSPKHASDMPATMKKGMAIDKQAKEWMKKTITDDVSLLKEEVIQRLAFTADASILTIERWLKKSVVNEEPACRYQTRMDDDENIWVELKSEYRKEAK